MKHLEEHQWREYAPPYDPNQVDFQFVPFLERINAKPFAASVQCCIGHCEYHDRRVAPANSEGRWGYLELLMTGPSAVWLCQEVIVREWLIVPLSKMWGPNVREPPSYTDWSNFLIAFAWDASWWPTPAEEICALLDKYHAADPDEPRHLLKVSAPDERRAHRRPSPCRSKRRRLK